MSQTRRQFFKHFCCGETVKLIQNVQKSFAEAKSDADYFTSYETCYPLISEYAYFLDDETKDLDIDSSGKTAMELSQMVYDRAKRPKG